MDIAYDEAKDTLWTGHTTGLCRIDLSGLTTTQYTVANGKLTGLDSASASITTAALSSYNDRVFINSRGTNRAWMYDNNVLPDGGWLYISNTSPTQRACGIISTTDERVVTITTTGSTPYQYFETHSVSITGKNAGTKTTLNNIAYTPQGGLEYYTAVLTPISPYIFCNLTQRSVGGDVWMSLYNISTYTLEYTLLYGSFQSIFSSDMDKAAARNTIDMGNSLKMIPFNTVSNLLSSQAASKLLTYKNRPLLFGWSGSAWDLNSVADLPIRTVNNPLLDGLTLDFNNNIGSNWDTNFILNERFAFMYGPMQIPDNLQEYSIANRWYYCKMQEGTTSQTVPAGTYIIRIPECPTGTSPNPDYRDMDILGITISVTEGAFTFTQVSSAPTATGQVWPKIDGTFTFHSSDVGRTVAITYNYTLYS